jgi:hypothetical protein
MEAAQQTTTTPQSHPQEPLWNIGYRGGFSGHHEGGSYYPSHGYPKCYTTKCDMVEDDLTECASEGNPGA